MVDIKKLVKDFWGYLKESKIEIYNEFSLQFELGIYLRKELPGYKVQFERNVSYFGITKKTIKHEIDIVIFNNDMTEKCAIELKFPRNGQVPEQMFKFIEDIVFMEELKRQGFDTYTLTVVDKSDKQGHLFYEGKSTEGIYRHFRAPGTNAISGTINKPTGDQNSQLTVQESYNIEWKDLQINEQRMKYYLLQI